MRMEEEKVFKKVMLFFCFFLSISVSGQITVDDNTFTAQELIEDILIDSPCAVVENITSFTGTNFGFNGIGYFNANNSGFEIEEGVILSTGSAKNAEGPNSSVLRDGDGTGWGGDNDLESITNTSGLFNATYIQFDFVPTVDFISFQFLFASEEYTGAFACSFSDVFAFILTESGGVAKNLAVVPNTNPPVPIKVTTVNPGVDLNDDGDFNDSTNSGNECPPQNPNFFNKKIPQRNADGVINFNGYTKIFTASSSVIPNRRYTIKLVIADNADGQFDSAVFLKAGSFNFGGELGEDRTVSSGNPGCIGEPIILDATIGNNASYTWTKDGAPLSPGDGTTLLSGDARLEVTQNGTYKVDISISSGCNASDTAMIEFVAPPNVTNSVSLVQCDDDIDGFSLFNLSEANSLISANHENEKFTYYLTEQQSIVGNVEDQITDFTSYTNPIILNSIVYARIESATDCFKTSRINLQVSTTQIPSNFNLTYTECEIGDGNPIDGIVNFDFSEATSQIANLYPNNQNLIIRYYRNELDALSEQNEIMNITNYRNTTSPFTQKLYVRVEDNIENSCLGFGEHITLSVNPFNPIAIEKEYILCMRSDEVVLNLQPTDRINTDLNPSEYTFKWYTGTTPVSENEIIGETIPSFLPNQPGEYNVLATEISTGCKISKSTVVTASYPPESISVNFLTGAFSQNNRIEVLVTGNGEYEFRIDNDNWQEDNIFTGISKGEHVVYVRDIHSCGELENAFEIVDFPKYFTPNGDGFHDSWGIKGSKRVSIINTRVFDRFGKFLGIFGPAENWDGTYNGKVLPSSDYWFVVKYLEEEIPKEFKANFSLIR